MKSESCVKCSSTRVIPDVEVWDRSDAAEKPEQRQTRLRIDVRPDAWVFKETCLVALRAWVCGDCGFTELYAREPRTLLGASLALQRQNETR